ncbi:MAG: nicotinate phosphoribosyltransferase [Candidatus Binatus sp.]|uniref:nicotinate phosphoribosyltransferase n=1 Tax=Candidatus Binatus sp. TaxID=2811406 RepID=UPI002723A044|nr:nicotinate phosphoribosyltransferase [Candidatus Binatus sp.]MDO8433704.1 nicotinate phosphoribosyltransferase [Candidatus Binatus sp.]
MPIDLRLDPSEVALFTDLYELAVGAALLEHGFNETASFELSMRRMPPGRGYMVAAGVERLIEALEEYRFDAEAIAHLESLQLFKPEFLDYLSRLRFTGSVRAIPEGALYFANEPILEIRAPIIEAQLIETLVLNQLGFASIVATKAARCFSVAGGRRLVDFGPRRAQGADAALIVARSSYIAGFHGSANVLAGKRYGIPVYGTMSHSFVMAHEHERDAFRDFTASFLTLSTLLVDTYDTLRGVENAAQIAAAMRERGVKIQGVRLDSGDLQELSRKTRRILDAAGFPEIAIVASGDLDEYKIAELVDSRAPIDAFGVGTSLAVSDDAPAADFVYKLVEYAGHARLKMSQNKASTPGRKQLFRAHSATGAIYADMVGIADESITTVAREFRPAPAKTVALLETIVERGRRVMPRPTIDEARERLMNGLTALDARHKTLQRPAEFSVRQTAALNALVISEKLRVDKRQD